MGKVQNKTAEQREEKKSAASYAEGFFGILTADEVAMVGAYLARSESVALREGEVHVAAFIHGIRRDMRSAADRFIDIMCPEAEFTVRL